MRYLTGILFIVFFILALSCKSYKIEDDGITLWVKDTANTISYSVKIEVISDNIIRVQSGPNKPVKERKSLVVEEKGNRKQIEWDYIDRNGSITIKTANLNIEINKTTGNIAFYDHNGNAKLIEKEHAGKSFKPVNIDGKEYFEIRQVFNSPENEAFYGLGQHQNGQMNYKGEDVDLFQHNIVVVVPFVMSNKNYGILWDNYSISKFGDPRNYKPLSILQLFDEAGNPGGLTARYYNSRDQEAPFLERIEPEINYKYTPDLKKLPDGFSGRDGRVEWNGFIGSDQSGLFKMRSHSAGYTKIWIDSKLVVDNWRQTWNPWTTKFKVNIEAGKKIPIKMEWVPDGGGSYIALECLTPYDEEGQNDLSLYSEVGECIDYYFVNGNNLDEVISGYRQLTGKSPIMPKWAMGLWQSRERYKTQEDLLNVVKEYRKRQIPLDNIVLDWHYWEEDKWGDHSFDRTRFPDPEGMMDELHNELNANIMISVWPKYYENTSNYKIMHDNGWLYMQNIKNRQKDWVGPGYVSTFYDAFNAKAREAYWGQLRDSLYVKGVDAWWLDATEPDILSNISNDDRKLLMSPTALGPAAEYFNAYSLLHCKCVYEGQRAVDPNKRVFILTRSAFAGQQKYAAATWSGDVASRWSDLKDQIAAGANFCVSGIPYWTTDIGGFSMEGRYINATGEDLDEWRELNLRWFQFGAFSPLFRIHGQYPFREIFHIAPEGHPVYKSMVYYDRLRYRLMPYIYSLAGMTYHQDYTIMRPLVMDHEIDTNVLDIADEYMFGPDLLVCPVYEFKASSREVYLPSTSGWYDLLSGEYFAGGKSYTMDAPLEKIPIFAKEGSILAVGPEMQYTNEKLTDPITLYVFDGKDGAFTLYEDDGLNYDYEQGLYSTIKLAYQEDGKTLTIGKQEGHFPGMLKERSFIVTLVTKDAPGGLDSPGLPSQKLNYNGRALQVSF